MKGLEKLEIIGLKLEFMVTSNLEPQDSNAGYYCKYCGISNLPTTSVSVVSRISIITAEPAAVAKTG